MAENNPFEGLLLGLAVGDALGLPREGVSKRRADKIYGRHVPLRHALLGRWGLCSDDSEHAWMTAQALLSSSDSTTDFTRALAWRLRFWFLSLPAGIGMATARACIRLWLGFPPGKSGVNSAGNGPAMRAPLIGAFFADRTDILNDRVLASTRLTHTDARACEGAWVIAMAAACAMRHDDAEDCRRFFFDAVMPALQGEELKAALRIIQTALSEGSDPRRVASCLQIGNGVSGYINRTVPAVLYAWLRHYGDYRATVEYLIRLGGDTDTTAAIAGALAGITCGREGIPAEWLDGVIEWPAGLHWMRSLAAQLHDKHRSETWRMPHLFWPALPLRNLLFLCIVLLHGFRRLLPPY